MNFDRDSIPDIKDSSNIRRGRFRLLPILLFGIFFIFYFLINQSSVPITGRRQLIDLPQSEEIGLGVQSYESFLADARVIESGSDLSLIRGVGTRIARAANIPEFDWQFNLVASPEINAFCLPGGKVAIYTGILPIAQSAEGLAVVMGHEIAHAIARHGAERISQQHLAQLGELALGAAVGDMDWEHRRLIMGAFGIGTQYGLLLPFSRIHESEADRIGLILMARACFDPQEAPRFWQRMASANSRTGKPPEFLSTHPDDQTRIDQLKSWLPDAMVEYNKFCR